MFNMEPDVKMATDPFSVSCLTVVLWSILIDHAHPNAPNN